jgi:hypothetical protein
MGIMFTTQVGTTFLSFADRTENPHLFQQVRITTDVGEGSEVQSCRAVGRVRASRDPCRNVI